ncbi:MAG: cupin domain-containing protein [Acidimicrobiales bacterium]
MLAMRAHEADRDRWFAGTLLRVIAGRADTEGNFSVLEQRARRGFSPPLHVHHREDTALLVLEGELTVAVGDVEQGVSAGGFVWLPRNVPHSFRVESEEVHLLEFATPGGVEGFHIDASDVAGEPLLPPATEPDIARMVGSVANYGIDLVGPPMG